MTQKYLGQVGMELRWTSLLAPLLVRMYKIEEGGESGQARAKSLDVGIFACSTFGLDVVMMDREEQEVDVMINVVREGDDAKVMRLVWGKSRGNHIWSFHL